MLATNRSFSKVRLVSIGGRHRVLSLVILIIIARHVLFMDLTSLIAKVEIKEFVV